MADELKSRAERWCRALRTEKCPDFVPGGRSYYWKKTCFIDVKSRNIDHDIVHELVHFRDDLKFDLETVREIRGILKVFAVLGVIVVLLLNSVAGSFMVISCAIATAVIDLFTEGRAEFYAIRLAGASGRMRSFVTLIAFNAALIVACVILVAFILSGVISLQATLILTSAATSLAILSVVSDALVK